MTPFGIIHKPHILSNMPRYNNPWQEHMPTMSRANDLRTWNRHYRTSQEALAIFTLEQHPLNYAESHNLLATLYKERIEYDRIEELEKALLSCQNALRVYTLVRFPRRYASTQNLMGALYMRKVAGARKANIEEAITCHQRALQVFTLES